MSVEFLLRPPLVGIRVIDFGHYIAGPIAGMLLADQGAEVIKVDRPGRPDADSLPNAVFNRGKQQLELDLKTPEGRESAIKLIRRRLQPRLCEPRELATMHYLISLERLAEVGEKRRRGETREGFARRISDRFPSLEVLTREHLRSSLAIEDGAHRRAAEAAAQLRQEIHQEVPARARWWGVLNAYSWTDTI